MISGIYKISNIQTNKFYIGSANNLKRRKIEHWKLLRHNKHPNKHLQSAWIKYSGFAFEFQIIELCEPQKLIEREQFYLDLYNSYDKEIGYNLNPVAGSNFGYKFSEEFRIKARARQLGKTRSVETRARMSKSHKNKKRHPTIGKKISATKKGKGVGRKLPEIQKVNMRLAQKERRDKDFFKTITGVICL